MNDTNNFSVSGLNPAVVRAITPMLEDITAAHKANVHSFHVVGSAVMGDYDEKLSDINSVVVLHRMDLAFIAFLAPLGKKYGTKRIAAPLVMTPEYIKNSLDSFPVEFLDFKLIHKTVFGDDLFTSLEIARPALRLQCEREIKTKLIHLRQGYISSLGKRDRLAAELVRSITGSMALFRAVILLSGAQPPLSRAQVVTDFGSAARIESGVFENLLLLKAGRIKPSERELVSLFETYHTALEAAGKMIDDLTV